MQSVIVYTIGGLAEQLVGVLVSPLMTRLLSPDQYGVLGLIAAFFSTTALFRVAGMDSAFPYFRLRFAEAENLTVLRNTATYISDCWTDNYCIRFSYCVTSNGLDPILS